MPYSTIDKPSKYFNTVLYTGNGTTNAITGVGFQPDFVWCKNRPSVLYHGLYDAVRGTGTTKSLASNSTEAEGANADYINLTSFNSDGFTLGATVNTNQINKSGENHVSWNWLGANTTVSNTSGSITSTVSANTTSGFSIVSYTGNGTSGATVGHGLGVAPKMIIIKNRTRVDAWPVDARQVSGIFYLNETGTKGSYGSAEPFVSTAPTSTVFSLGSAPNTNNSGSSLIAYCFAEVKGFSKFGFYLGNGNADGRFVYTGFKPAFLLIKRNVSATNWQLFDNKRDPYNVMYKILSPNNTNAEATADPTITNVDFLSNGFKLPTTWNGVNGLDSTYVYMCFAENPFVSTKSIPTTAR
jgi:hypothetical protein